MSSFLVLVALVVAPAAVTEYLPLSQLCSKRAGAGASRRLAFEAKSDWREVKVHKTPTVYAMCETQGWRPEMEDAVVHPTPLPPPFDAWVLAAVCDGHGGAMAAALVAERLAPVLAEKVTEATHGRPLADGEDAAGVVGECLTAAFRAVDRWLHHRSDAQKFEFMGSTCCAVVTDLQTLVCANIGDSRAMVLNGAGQLVATLSTDHKPEREVERARIIQAGGSVKRAGPCFRVDGWGLNVSRCFGDFHYKRNETLPPAKQKITAEPEIQVIRLREHESSDPRLFLAITCDGVFELLNNAKVAQIVGTIATSGNGDVSAGQALRTASERLVIESISPNLLQTQGRGADNVTVLLLRLTP